MKKLEVLQNETDFFADYNHELRTALHGVVGVVNLLSLTALSAEQKHYVNTLKGSMGSVLELLNDALDFARSDFVVDEKPIFLPHLLKDVYNLFYANAKLKNLDFKVEISGDLEFEVISDEKLIKQVLNNLVNNAIKFTYEGFVHLHVSILHVMKESVVVQFMVKDSGRGISPSHLSRLFERYYKGEKSKDSGSGLGLAISKKCVEAMGGEITVSSQVGAGSTFCFELILKRSAVAYDRSELTETVETLGHYPGIRVLIVEDDPISLFMLEELLKKMDIIVLVATNGEDALNIILHSAVDLVFMDVNMPKLNGIDTTRMLRMKGNRTPIVAITAYAMQGDRERCLDAGMDDYISKPIQFYKLESGLKKWLHSQNEDIEDDFDIAIEKLMEASGLDEETSKFVFKTYVDQSFGIVESIKEKHQQGLVSDVLSLLHKLKGSSGNVRAYKIMKISEALERAVKLEQMDTVIEKMDSTLKLLNLYQQHLQHVTALLD